MATKTVTRPAQRSAPPKNNQRPAQRPAPTQNKAPTTSREVARREENLPSSVLAAASRHAGKGVSQRPEDNIVPLIYILQANSKPALEGHEKFIPGAKGGGVIWLRNLPNDDNIVDSILFQPCVLVVCWIEWQPDRGGFVMRHMHRPEEAALGTITKDDGTEVQAWKMPNGNIVVESREVSGFVIGHGDHDPMPYTIPFSGSGHTIAKQWNTQMKAEKLPNGDAAPSFLYLYEMRPILRTKDDNSWYVFDIAKHGAVENEEDVERGAELYDAFMKGLKQSAALDEGARDTGSGQGDGGQSDDPA